MAMSAESSALNDFEIDFSSLSCVLSAFPHKKATARRQYYGNTQYQFQSAKLSQIIKRSAKSKANAKKWTTFNTVPNAAIIAFNQTITDPVGSAFFYTRTSSSPLPGSSSHQVQRLAMYNYCRQHRLRIEEIYADVGRSAKNMDTLYQFQKMCLDIVAVDAEDLPKTLLVYDVSRFSRNTKQALDAIEYLYSEGIATHFIMEQISYTSSYNRHMFRTCLSGAQFLSEQVGEKVRAAIAIKRSQGHHIGGVKYGFKRVANVLVKDANEFKLMKSIAKLHQSQNTAKSIAETLNSQSKTIRGRRFTAHTVKLLASRFNDLSK